MFTALQCLTTAWNIVDHAPNNSIEAPHELLTWDASGAKNFHLAFLGAKTEANMLF